MMLHTENPEDATRWLLDLINEQSKLAEYKIYRELLHIYTLMIYHKVKLMKQSHSPPQRKQYNSNKPT